MGLPHARHETFVANDVAGGSILMAVQQWCVRFFRKNARKKKTLNLSALGSRGTAAWGTYSEGAGTNYVASASVGDRHVLPLWLVPGTALDQLTFRLFRNGATTVTLQLNRRALTGTAAIETLQTVSGGTNGAWADVLITPPVNPYIIDAGYTYWLVAIAGQTGDRLSQVRVEFHHPG